MQIICVSRGTYEGGKELAEALAKRLGIPCLAREEATDAATRAGIHVGKLEMAVVRRHPLSEYLAVEREKFQAFITATLCERAREEGLVYHGRTGHLVLPGVSPVFRIRVIADTEARIAQTMDRLGLSREKARLFNEQVDEDIRRWVRVLYNVDGESPDLYDVVVNLSHVSVENAASALVAMAQLPEFQVTPASRRALEDLHLAARCRLAIGGDRRTRGMQVRVRADRGRVSVTWLPRDRKAAPAVPSILEEIEGVREVVCTMATTNLLWIEEDVDPDSETLPQILEIAEKWNAAVEILRLEDGEGEAEAAPAGASGEPGIPDTEAEGGILDDGVEVERLPEDAGVRETMGRLVSAGRAGGYRAVRGGAREILQSLDRTSSYSLVVVGRVFSSKGVSTAKRLSRELAGSLADALRVPVIGSDELRSQYLFGPGHWLKLALHGALAALLLFLVFTYQAPILEFLARGGTRHRILAAAALFLFVPLFAHLYGSFARYLFRLMKIE